MSEYGYTIEYLTTLTRHQMFMFIEKIGDRKQEYYKFHAKIHGAYKHKGLDTDNAIAIEEVLDRGNIVM
jgi:hypothetical protein